MREESRMEKVVDFENLETSDAIRVGRSVVPGVWIAARWSCAGSVFLEMTELEDCAGSGDSDSIAVMGAALWLENGSNHIPSAGDRFLLFRCPHQCCTLYGFVLFNKSQELVVVTAANKGCFTLPTPWNPM